MKALQAADTDRHRGGLRMLFPKVSCLGGPGSLLAWVHIQKTRHQTCQSF